MSAFGYPTILRRYLSSLIDGFILIVVSFSIFGATAGPGGPPHLVIAIIYFLCLSYEPVLTWKFRTIGQTVAGIRVRKFEHPDQHIDLMDAYIRFMSKYVLGFICIIMISINKERRGLHDQLAGSIVLDAKSAT